MYNYLLLCCMTLYMFSCASVKSQNSSDSASAYKEDLSLVRPKYTQTTTDVITKNANTNSKAFTPTQDITKQLNSKIDTLAVRNKKMKFAQGFRVLVYTGNSSDEVKHVRLKLRGLVANEPVYDEYKQPTFRVKVGDCYSRLEAYYLLSQLQKDFINAIVVPDQINIVKEK